MWQDIVIMLACYGFVGALVPSIISKVNKPSRLTCLFTAVLLTAMVICFATLGLWLSMVAETLGALAWLVLLIQKRKHNENKKWLYQ